MWAATFWFINLWQSNPIHIKQLPLSLLSEEHIKESNIWVQLDVTSHFIFQYFMLVLLSTSSSSSSSWNHFYCVNGTQLPPTASPVVSWSAQPPSKTPAAELDTPPNQPGQEPIYEEIADTPRPAPPGLSRNVKPMVDDHVITGKPGEDYIYGEIGDTETYLTPRPALELQGVRTRIAWWIAGHLMNEEMNHLWGASGTRLKADEDVVAANLTTIKFTILQNGPKLHQVSCMIVLVPFILSSPSPLPFTPFTTTSCLFHNFAGHLVSSFCHCGLYWQLPPVYWMDSHLAGTFCQKCSKL